MNKAKFLKAQAEARRALPKLDQQIRAITNEVAVVRKAVRACAKALRK